MANIHVVLIKEGPKNKKSKWYHADKKWSSYQVDIDIFFLSFSIGFVCSEELDAREHLRTKVQTISYICVAFDNLLAYLCIKTRDVKRKFSRKGRFRGSSPALPLSPASPSDSKQLLRAVGVCAGRAGFPALPLGLL